MARMGNTEDITSPSISISSKSVSLKMAICMQIPMLKQQPSKKSLQENTQITFSSDILDFGGGLLFFLSAASRTENN